MNTLSFLTSCSQDDDEIMIDEILLIGAATWKLGLMIELLQVQVASKHQMH